VFGGAIQNGNYFIAGMFLLGAFMTILYLFRVFNMVFLGVSKNPLAKEGSFLMVASVVVLAVLSLAGGILVQYPVFFAQGAAHQMLGMVK
jgi:NADH-quinone oxidoreductase subunit L